MLISFESPDGGGKSTHSKLLVEKLRAVGKEVKFIHFPRYESSIGGFIGKVLKGEETVKNFKALQMMYVADQLDIQVELEEWLKDENTIVVFDRYDLSTLAYYTSKLGCSINEALADVAFKWQSDLIKPDITFVIDFNGDIDERRAGSGKEKDIMEKDDKIVGNINNTYQEFVKKLSPYRKIVVIDGDKSKEHNEEIIYNKVINFMNTVKREDLGSLSKKDKIQPF